MMDFFNTWKNNKDYMKMVELIAQLSNLFSNSDTPYIHYRVTENLFCKYFNATNLARTDTAYDANIGKLGIGIKTFILPNQVNHKIEKVAEFNDLSSELHQLKGKNLALKLAEFRNERINVANNLYNIEQSIYHIIGRRKGKLQLFNTPYELINSEQIVVEKDDVKSIKFHDNKNEYSFNKSKSVLFKDFLVPQDTLNIDVKIIEDPYELLEKLLVNGGLSGASTSNNTRPFIVLPLYSVKGTKGNKMKVVCEKSGLNQWNARGRKRCENEVYIPIPKDVHNNWPDFFPSRDKSFELYLPDGTILSAKICQENGKALMSNPNSALGEWLLRKVLNKQPGHIITYRDLQQAGFDSIVVYKNPDDSYSIDVSFSESYNYKSFYEE